MVKCLYCEGSGASPEMAQLKNLWYGLEPFEPEDRGSIPFTPDNQRIIRIAKRNLENSNGVKIECVTEEMERQRLCRLFNRSWSHHVNELDIIALVEADRLIDFTHFWDEDKREFVKKDPPYTPTPKEVNEWSLCGFGHDSINQWVVCEAEAKRLGYKTKFFRCKGEGEIWPSPQNQKTV